MSATQSSPIDRTVIATPTARRAGVLTPFRTAMLVSFMTFAAAALRLHLLSAQSLWIDEASSVHFAKIPWWPFLKTLWGYQGNMTLYYFLLRAWIHLGDSEFVVRGLSALFGILTIPAIYGLGRRLFDQATGLIAAAFLAVHSFHVGWSREARAYSLFAFLLVVTTYFLVLALESKRQKRYLLSFAISSALCFYVHIFAILVLPAHALALIFSKPFRVKLRAIAEAAIVFALLCVPMAAFVLLRHSSQIDWIMRPSWPEIAGFLELLTGQGGGLLIVLYLALIALAYWTPAGRLASDREKWATRLLLFWLILPPFITLAATPVKPLFHPGFMLMCVPPLVILAARGVTNLYRSRTPLYRTGAAVALVLLLTLSSVAIAKPVNYPYTAHADWRSATGYILEHQQLGDGAVFFIPNSYCYEYYVHRAERVHPLNTAPEVLYPPLSWEPVSRAEILRVTYGHPRVWLVLHLDTPPAGVAARPKEVSIIQSTLAENFHLVSTHVFQGENSITVALYSRTQTTP